MSRRFLPILVLAAAPLLPGAAQPPAGRRADAVRRGASADEVRKFLGNPSRIARQVLFQRHLEQWVYDDPAVRVELLFVRGEEPYVLSVWPAVPGQAP